jgi:hypothetical protein
MSFKIGFTGTQFGMTNRQKKSFIRLLLSQKIIPTEFHHGDCIGADEQANKIVGIIPKIVIHPPSFDAKRAFCFSRDVRSPKPYIERNHDIVDETDVLIACPRTKEEELRSGTWATIRYARKTGKPIWYIWPDGLIDLPV